MHDIGKRMKPENGRLIILQGYCITEDVRKGAVSVCMPASALNKESRAGGFQFLPFLKFLSEGWQRLCFQFSSLLASGPETYTVKILDQYT